MDDIYSEAQIRGELEQVSEWLWGDYGLNVMHHYRDVAADAARFGYRVEYRLRIFEIYLQYIRIGEDGYRLDEPYCWSLQADGAVLHSPTLGQLLDHVLEER